MKHPEWLYKAKVYAIPRKVLGETEIRYGELIPTQDAEWCTWEEPWGKYKSAVADNKDHKIADGRVWLVERKCYEGMATYATEYEGVISYEADRCETCRGSGVTHELVREDAEEVIVPAHWDLSPAKEMAAFIELTFKTTFTTRGLRFISETGERHDVMKGE